jgi:hypothetical protein
VLLLNAGTHIPEYMEPQSRRHYCLTDRIVLRACSNVHVHVSYSPHIDAAVHTDKKRELLIIQYVTYKEI